MEKLKQCEYKTNSASYINTLTIILYSKQYFKVQISQLGVSSGRGWKIARCPLYVCLHARTKKTPKDMIPLQLIEGG